MNESQRIADDKREGLLVEIEKNRFREKIQAALLPFRAAAVRLTSSNSPTWHPVIGERVHDGPSRQPAAEDAPRGRQPGGAELNAVKWELKFGEPNTIRATPEKGVLLIVTKRSGSLRWRSALIVNGQVVHLNESAKLSSEAKNRAEKFYARHCELQGRK